MYSQNDEDEIISDIFEEIGTESRKFFEIGVGDGLECNTRALRERGWKGYAIDKDHDTEHVTKSFVTIGNISYLYSGYLLGQTCKQINQTDKRDFLSIDVDGNDYYLLMTILLTCKYKPRVICIEYNKHYKDNRVQGYDPTSVWDGSENFGASLSALKKLTEQYGYRFYGTDKNKVNAFFIKK